MEVNVHILLALWLCLKYTKISLSLLSFVVYVNGGGGIVYVGSVIFAKLITIVSSSLHATIQEIFKTGLKVIKIVWHDFRDPYIDGDVGQRRRIKLAYDARQRYTLHFPLFCACCSNLTEERYNLVQWSCMASAYAFLYPVTQACHLHYCVCVCISKQDLLCLTRHQNNGIKCL